MQTLEHLFEVVFADGLREGTRVCNIVEQLAAINHFLSDVGYLTSAVVALLPDALLAEVEVLNHVVVLELLRGCDLLS